MYSSHYFSHGFLPFSPVSVLPFLLTLGTSLVTFATDIVCFSRCPLLFERWSHQVMDNHDPIHVPSRFVFLHVIPYRFLCHLLRLSRWACSSRGLVWRGSLGRVKDLRERWQLWVKSQPVSSYGKSTRLRFPPFQMLQGLAASSSL
jgi:hypothetical protein